MKISLASSYLSINSFPDIVLPDFCLVTGVNGVGKSHFLQALQNANLRSDIAPQQSPSNQREIRLFDWNSLVPQDPGVFTTEALRDEKVTAFNQYNQLVHQPGMLENIRNIVRARQLPEKYVRDPVSAALLSVAQLEPLCGQHSAQAVYNQLHMIARETEHQLLNQISDPFRSRILAVVATSGKHLFNLTQADFFQSKVPSSSWGTVNIFQQSFARLFVAYRDANLANQLGQFLAAKGETEVQYVTDEVFLRENGHPPWNFVNESLATAGLDFMINHPTLNENTPFQPELTKLSTGVKVPFGALSSGEKILMSFAFCVYYSNDRRQLSLYPKMILLDEVDAPLHPSMSRDLINTIQKTLVESYWNQGYSCNPFSLYSRHGS